MRKPVEPVTAQREPGTEVHRSPGRRALPISSMGSEPSQGRKIEFDRLCETGTGLFTHRTDVVTRNSADESSARSGYYPPDVAE